MKPRAAFTLVELLVVIGIIALLIALLMPVLGAARASAVRIKCLATLRSMAQAAHSHAQEHRGYMPAAGAQGPVHLGASATAEGLLDVTRQKYLYYGYGVGTHGPIFRPWPLPAALAYYMGFGPLLVARERDFARASTPVLAEEPIVRLFECPGQDPETLKRGYVLSDGDGFIYPTAKMGYLFNGSFLARGLMPYGETPAGKLARVRRADEVFLFADGVAPTPFSGGYGSYEVKEQYSAEATLVEHCWFTGRQQMDFLRHGGRINVVFVDGHAETLILPNPRRPIDSRNPDNRGTADRAGVTRGIAF